jgi:hypothetical protein
MVTIVDGVAHTSMKNRRMYKYSLGTEVQGAEYIQGVLISLAEGKIVKRKRWSGENWYTLDVGNVYLEDEIKEITYE